MTGFLMLAALWGFAEATLFVVVPDVAVSLAALLRGRRAGFLAAVAASIGAFVGGGLMMAWGAGDPLAARAGLDALPAISPAMIAMVGTEMAAADWPIRMLQGVLSGVPYKVFAVEAGAAGVTPLLFLGWTIPARMARFVVVALGVDLMNRLVANRLGPRSRLVMLIVGWVAFYAWFWSRMPG